ncbi:MAG TPA: hypothetical protein VMR86_09295 [Myxococcota bacterium]|nr:hypothetical protein [Myxococcota bacterium]
MRELGVVAGLWLAASVAGADPANGNLGATFALPGSAMDVRIHYASAGSGASALAGEGSLGANLPLDGRLTVRVPVSVGSSAMLGDTQVAAGYALLHESNLLPRLAVTAELALPTAPGSHGARPGVKATAAKKLLWGPVRDFHVETELRTEGRGLARSYRTAVGTHLQILKSTTASIDLVTLRPSGRSLLPRDDQAQIGICQEVTKGTKLRLGLGAGVTGGQSSLRSTVGIDWRF